MDAQGRGDLQYAPKYTGDENTFFTGCQKVDLVEDFDAGIAEEFEFWRLPTEGINKWYVISIELAAVGDEGVGSIWLFDFLYCRDKFGMLWFLSASVKIIYDGAAEFFLEYDKDGDDIVIQADAEGFTGPGTYRAKIFYRQFDHPRDIELPV